MAVTRKPAPLKKCKGKTKAGEPCQRWALPNRRYCHAHGKKYHGNKSEESKAVSLANLAKGRGKKPPEPPPEPATLAERIKTNRAALVIRDADGNAPEADLGSVESLSRAQVDLARLNGLSHLSVRQERRRERLEDKILAYSEQLGFTPASRARLAAYAVQQAEATRATVRVQPVRTVERGQRVSELLAASCAVPLLREQVALIREIREAGGSIWHPPDLQIVTDESPKEVQSEDENAS